jgi:hypothetical protein
MSVSEQHIPAVAAAGAFGTLVSLMLYGPRPNIQSNAAMCFANMARSGTHYITLQRRLTRLSHVLYQRRAAARLSPVAAWCPWLWR